MLSPRRTCPEEAPSEDLAAAHTRTLQTTSENHWKRGGRDGLASLQSGWKNLSPQTPEVRNSDITPLTVEPTLLGVLIAEKRIYKKTKGTM